jgi:hypothetical protein
MTPPIFREPDAKRPQTKGSYESMSIFPAE